MVLVTLTHRNNPVITKSSHFNIHNFHDASDLYEYVSEHAFAMGLDVTTAVEVGALSGTYSTGNNSKLGDIIYQCATGDILQVPLAGKFRLTPDGDLFFLVLQWRGGQDPTKWQWFVPGSTDWQVFRESVQEVFADAVLFARMGEYGQDIDDGPFPDDFDLTIQLHYLEFDTHEYRAMMIDIGLVTGSAQLYDQMRMYVFGGYFLPISFRAAVVGQTQMRDDLNPDTTPLQTVVGLVQGDIADRPVVGQIGLNREKQLALLVVRWEGAGGIRWKCYDHNEQDWEMFRSHVRAIQAYALLLAQL